MWYITVFFFQAEDGIRDRNVTEFRRVLFRSSNNVNNIQQANIDVKAILGNAEITINEFLNLRMNDVVTLNKTIDEPLTLDINNKPKFNVQPGKYKNKLSVQILNKIKGGQ